MARPKLTDEEKAARKAQREAEKAAKLAAMVPFAESDEAKAAGILNENGRLSTHENLLEIIDPEKHKNPKRVDFENEHDYLFYRSARAEANAAEQMDMSARFREQAETLANEPDPERRKAKLQLAKMAAKMAELKALLGDEAAE